MRRLALAFPALLLAACAGTTHGTASTASTSSPLVAPKTVIDAHGVYQTVIDGNGTYIVGVDIPAGDYRGLGGTTCYWARLHSVDPSEVIESKQTTGPQVIGIQGSDAALVTQNCGTWQMIERRSGPM